MTPSESNGTGPSTSRRAAHTLLGLLLAALVFASGCIQRTETTQRVQQQEETSGCNPTQDNFDADWPRIVAEHRERDRHKALAYSNAMRSRCFVWGYSYGYDRRQEAVERALSACRTVKANTEQQRGQRYYRCTLHSIDDERQ